MTFSKERVEKLEKDGELDCSGLSDGGFFGVGTEEPHLLL